MPFLNRALRSAVVCLAGMLAPTVCFLAIPTGAADQSSQPAGPNSDPTYQACATSPWAERRLASRILT